MAVPRAARGVTGVTCHAGATAAIHLSAVVKEFAPPADLQPFIEAFWRSSGQGSARVLPDGCADVVIDLRDATLTAVGTMTRPLVIESGREMFGVRFRAGCAAAFFGTPLSEFTDARIPVRDRGLLAARVSDAGSDHERRSVAAAAIRQSFHERALDARLTAAVGQIVQSGGRRSIDSISETVGISRQHLARLFAHHVGTSPKTFARITRFRRALRLAPKQRWPDLALELGYFDQSHLIREFRQFAGETPVPFFLSR